MPVPPLMLIVLPPLPEATLTVCAPAALLAIETVFEPEPLARVTVVAVLEVPIAVVPEPFTVRVPVTVRFPGVTSELGMEIWSVLPDPVTVTWPAVPIILILPPDGTTAPPVSPVSCATVPVATPTCCHTMAPFTPVLLEQMKTVLFAWLIAIVPGATPVAVVEGVVVVI